MSDINPDAPPEPLDYTIIYTVSHNVEFSDIPQVTTFSIEDGLLFFFGPQGLIRVYNKDQVISFQPNRR